MPFRALLLQLSPRFIPVIIDSFDAEFPSAAIAVIIAASQEDINPIRGGAIAPVIYIPGIEDFEG